MSLKQDEIGKKPGLQLTNLSVLGEESEDDEGREDEIKELLAHAFSTETLEEDDGDMEPEDVPLHSERRPEERKDKDNGGGESAGSGESVSFFHGNHCPGERGTGDPNGNYDNRSWTCEGAEAVEELKTLAEFRERQVNRAEEQIELLGKEKRALTHQVALMRMELLAMKATEEESQKTLQSKEEEIDFLKRKLQETHASWENAKKSENETKDHNILLQSQIGKLNNEVKLLSAIGLSTKEAELNDALREARREHAEEISFWREKVSELEKKSSRPRSQFAEVQTEETMDNFAKRMEQSKVVEEETFKRLKSKDDELAFLKTKLRELYSEYEDAKRNENETKHQNMVLQNQVKKLSNEMRLFSASESSVKGYDPTENLVETRRKYEGEIKFWKDKVYELETIKSRRSDSVEVQTDETMETFRILGTLIESWVAEVGESEERARKAEAEAAELTKGLTILKKNFKKLSKLVILCRREWRNRESIIVERCNLAEERFRKFLITLGSNFETLEGLLPLPTDSNLNS